MATTENIARDDTSISVSRDMRDTLYWLKRPADSWDDVFERLLTEADIDPAPPPTQLD